MPLFNYNEITVCYVFKSGLNIGILVQGGCFFDAFWGYSFRPDYMFLPLKPVFSGVNPKSF
jgi:hypothetical protein